MQVKLCVHEGKSETDKDCALGDCSVGGLCIAVGCGLTMQQCLWGARP